MDKLLQFVFRKNSNTISIAWSCRWIPAGSNPWNLRSCKANNTKLKMVSKSHIKVMEVAACSAEGEYILH